jgi:hypothetical protein
MGRFSLIIVVGFAILAGGLKLSLGRWNKQTQDISNERYLDATARNVANSAVNLCLSQLAQSYSWRTGYSNFSVAGGVASATIQDHSTNPGIPVGRVRIQAQGTYAGKTCTADVIMSKAAFSEFAYFTDIEPVINFITGDTLKGPIHTNGQFHISGNPVFYGLVSSVATSWAGSGSPQFKAGTDFGAPRIDLPVDLSIIEGQAQSGGVQFHGATNLEFLNDGTFNWEVYHFAGSPSVKVTDSTGNKALSTTNGTLSTDANKDLHIKGTLSGTATVLCGGDIWIENDLVYAHNPLTDPNATDMLGLISKNNIYVADNAANQTSCNIHATMMALNQSFAVQNYDQGSPRGTLTIIGGVIQKQRGAVGTSSGGSIRTGYQKKYVYDERFFTKAPPNYPVYSRNTIVSWYE